ncbi:MAG: zinc ribbon domain-containing protein [Solirubrobacterales bacterium]
MPLAIFGIENTALNLVVTLAIFFIVALWLALIVFTFTDARRRIADPFLVGCATAASLFPFVGTIIYTVLRPPEFLEDIAERDTEMRASEVRLRHMEEHSCHKCGFPTETDFRRCPSCRTRLKEECPSCSKPVGLNWKLCPYCETALVAPPKRSSRSSSKQSGTSPKKVRKAPAKPDEPKRPSRSSSSRSSTSERSNRSTKPSRSAETAENKTAKPSSSQDSTKKSEPARRTSRTDRRKTIVPDEDSSARPINSGDGSPAPDRSPESR